MRATIQQEQAAAEHGMIVRRPHLGCRTAHPPYPCGRTRVCEFVSGRSAPLAAAKIGALGGAGQIDSAHSKEERARTREAKPARFAQGWRQISRSGLLV